MSDTQMDTPETSNGSHSHGGLKVRMPDLFYGDRSKLEDWILQFDRHFHIEGDKIESADKVVLVSTFMKGPAEKWVLPIIRKYMDDSIMDAGNTALVEHWDAFKIRLRQIFSPFKESVIAEQKIQKLKQTKSAADYTNVFQQYAEQIQWDNAALMRMYKQGLKPALLAELMRSGTAINDLEDLTREAIRLDNELYELALAERSYREVAGTRNEDKSRPQKPNRGFQPNQGRQRNTYQPQHPGIYRSNGPERMHLGNINSKPSDPKKTWKKNDGPETRSCYNCGKPGHLARNCRSKNKVIRQINMLTGPQQEDADEWTVVESQYDIEQGQHSRIIREKDQVLVDTDWELERMIRHYDKAPGQAERSHLASQLEAARIADKVYYDPKQDRYCVNPFTGESRRAARQAKQAVQRDIQEALAQQKWIDYQISEGNLSRSQVTKFERNGRLWTSDPTNAICAPERSDTPHPGDKVPTVWDYENFEEADNAEDRALTPEELDIHSSPASPTLSRHSTSRGYANDEQALVIQDNTKPYQYKDKDWTVQAEAEFQQQCLQGNNKDYRRTTRYLRDPRNSLHGTIVWTACAATYCPIHYEAKVNTSHFPTRKGCKWQWSECGTHKCPYHLWDKRTCDYFPELSEVEVEAQHAPLTNGSCLLSTWQLCLEPQCAQHQKDKLENGFFDDKTFLGSRNQSDDENYKTEPEDQSEGETSIQQVPAPGIEPEAAMQQMQDLSLNSQ
jgi:hypothetical protein